MWGESTGSTSRRALGGRSLCTALAVGAFALLAAAPASAQTQIGANLNRPVTATYDCTVKPPFGFQSGVGSCTYLGTPGPPVNNESTAAPATGVITRVRVKTLPPNGPLRVTVVRALAGTETGFTCCFYNGQSQVFTPQRGGVTSVPVRLPVESSINTDAGIQTVDYLGLTVLQPGTRIPAHDTGNTNGPEFSGVFYPHITPADRTSGRVDSNGTGGVLPLLNADFTPLCGAGGRRTPARSEAFSGNDLGLRTSEAKPSAGRCLGGVTSRNGSLGSSSVKVPVDCNLTVQCRGKLRLLAKKGKGKLGDSKLKIKSGQRKAIKVKLSKVGKRAAKGKRRLTVKVKAKVAGAPNDSTKVKLKR